MVDGARAVGLMVLGVAAVAVLVGMSHHADATDYWTVGVPTANTAIGPPSATANVAATNSGTIAGTVVLTKPLAAAPIQSVSVAPGATGLMNYDEQMQGSQISNAAVYLIQTSHPDFEVVQINPADSAGGSSDAARLLPEADLSTTYSIASYRDPNVSYVSSVYYEQTASFFTVVAIKDGTTVNVKVSTKTAASAVPGQVPSMVPGPTYPYLLNRGDALHVETPAVSNEYSLSGLTGGDLTGSTIVGSSAVAVFGGNTCSRVEDGTCDLIFTQMLPESTAGIKYVLCASAQSGTGRLDMMLVRPISGTSSTLTFANPVSTTSGPTAANPGAATYSPTVSTSTLTAPTWTKYYMKRDTVITATSPIQVMQFLAWSTNAVPVYGTTVPAENLVVTSQPERGYGDAAQTTIRPIEKSMTNHWFYAPATFVNYLYVGHPLTATLRLDGAAMTGATRAIATSGYGCTTQLVDGTMTILGGGSPGGTHHIEDLSGATITAQVVGLGMSTGIMYDTGSMPPIVPPVLPPVADFKWDAASGCGPHPIDFTDSSVPGTGTIVAWGWDFGDGTGSAAENPTHTYDAPGTYTVFLTVTDDNSLSDMTFFTVTADAGLPCIDPTLSEDNHYGPRPPHDGVDEDIAGGDADGDGIADAGDNCPLTANSSQADTDGDFAGDLCDVDLDADGAINAADNCPKDANGDQFDADADGEGDVCDADIDGDHVLNGEDNCPAIYNSEQDDVDTNNVGDACDVTATEPAAGAPATRPLEPTVGAVAAPSGANNALGTFVLAIIGAGVALGFLMIVVARRRQG